jgi:hypothetical protein
VSRGAPLRAWRLLAALALAVGAPATWAAGDARKQGTMAENRTAVGKITGVEVPDGGDGTLTLEGGTKVTLPQKSQLYDFWKGWLPERQAAGQRVFVEYDAAGVALRILNTIEWKVEGLGTTPDGDRLRVTLLMKPSSYWLRVGRPEYAAWRALLAEALQSKEPLLLVTQPETYEILHVSKPK